MRIAFALAGLALGVVATGACEEPHKQTDAVGCMAYLALYGTAVSEGRAPGDLTALDGAAAAWRAVAERKYGLDETAQYFASSVAVYDEIEISEIETLASRCAAEALAI